ncbi:MAG: class I SAM-dependent methyltransferase [Promethearchaeota archaeon]|nr:MAG: class I SAM-dependent methyltransferase [Candidatus Lokiarchaeota archaeon]
MKEHFKNYYKKKKIIKKYNSSSPFYDRRYRLIQEEKYKIVLKNYKVNGKKILDLGCGTGLFYEYNRESMIGNRETKSRYIALDISWNMLLEFKSKIAYSNHNVHVPDLILSDIEYLPFRDNIFSSIFSLTSFQNLPTIEKGIKELVRVSKNYSDFRLSILKKKLEIEALLKFLKARIKDPIITSDDKLEDIIIQGEIIKN